MTINKQYINRFRKVLDYIDQQLFQDIQLVDLCEVAAFSKFHFHRQFSAIFGISVFRYIQMKKLKRASYQLAFREHLSITDIALESGYENAESFTRAFKKTLGQTPSEFREKPLWNSWLQFKQHTNLTTGIDMLELDNEQNIQIDVIEFPETSVAVLEHRGSPHLLGDTIRHFIQWRREHNLSPKVSDTYNLVYDNPEQVADEDFRFDLCVSIQGPLPANDLGILSKTIPPGLCARVRHTGSDDQLGRKVEYLYSKWLPRSDYQVRDFPLFFHRVSFFPEVPEHEMITDIYLPLQ
ncbi:AraC family transcriptional regulator [Hahella ganghwensis]|uniref:AraC family transcriptional regulator n=1 Tax=Hahella ganghwensis TaxID=286420 RepID=UPI00039A8957|nr:AraC family transcriptional regulator [Hahella ganghwensis]